MYSEARLQRASTHAECQRMLEVELVSHTVLCRFEELGLSSLVRLKMKPLAS